MTYYVSLLIKRQGFDKMALRGIEWVGLQEESCDENRNRLVSRKKAMAEMSLPPRGPHPAFGHLLPWQGPREKAITSAISPRYRLLPFAPSRMGEGGRRPDEGPFFLSPSASLTGQNKAFLKMLKAKTHSALTQYSIQNPPTRFPEEPIKLSGRFQ